MGLEELTIEEIRERGYSYVELEHPQYEIYTWGNPLYYNPDSESNVRIDRSYSDHSRVEVANYYNYPTMTEQTLGFSQHDGHLIQFDLNVEVAYPNDSKEVGLAANMASLLNINNQLRLNHLRVDGEYRGDGIGSMLFDYARVAAIWYGFDMYGSIGGGEDTIEFFKNVGIPGEYMWKRSSRAELEVPHGELLHTPHANIEVEP